MKQSPSPQASASLGTDPVQGTPLSSQEMADLFSQFVAAERHVLWVVDTQPRERVHYVSPAFESLWGLSAQALYADSRLWLERVHPDDRAMVAAAFVRWVAAPLTPCFDVEYRLVRPDGSLRWVHSLGHPPLASAPHAGRCTGITEDVTERKLADQEVLRLNGELERRVAERTAELQAAVKEIEAFSYSVSHDLRAPLRALDGFSQVLPDCEADLTLLRQVWINLIGNAIKYTGQCPMALIEVGSQTAGGVTEYFVRDNGAGFDMQYVHKLFGVFERLHRSEEFEGSGVGLAIVQRIVQRHGGQVRAVGEVGRGATFSFTLGEDEKGPE